MGFNDILKSLFGNKADRDMKELRPIVAQVNAEWEKIKNLSHDELRALSADLRHQVHAYIQAEEDEIEALKRKVEEERPPIEERERIYDRVDKLEEQIDKKVEEILTELMPKAFAVMKDTARRFATNEEIEVTATQFDRDLAVDHDFVEIEGDKAICEQLKKDLDWETFIQYVQNVNEKEGECYVYIRGHIVKLNDETHYAVIIMHTIPWF